MLFQEEKNQAKWPKWDTTRDLSSRSTKRCIKLLDDETKASIGQMEKILPKLSKNIVCGNAVIDSKIWEKIPQETLDVSEIEKINVFDWEDKFGNILFDVIIGNPPYMQTKDMNKYRNTELKFFKKYYKTSKGQFDLYFIFIEKCYGLLSKDGQMGFIIPNKFIKNTAGGKLREFLSINNSIRKIIDFGSHQIWKKVITYNCILFLENRK